MRLVYIDVTWVEARRHPNQFGIIRTPHLPPPFLLSLFSPPPVYRSSCTAVLSVLRIGPDPSHPLDLGVPFTKSFVFSMAAVFS